MQRFSQSAVGVTRGSALLFSAFEDGGAMWSGHGPRVERMPVRFGERYLSPPVVHVSIGMWDIAEGSNQRADISADRITEEGFEIVFRTWGDTRVARIRAEWLAIGAVLHEDDFDL
ncbi:H-type lectin domain-containing protein [Paracoccus siganidrum]|uniref:H-type lectin domain-containing protein n=1 Tax=Paracoccus siganidrum TaxID=1276757 RepID=A0A419A4V3_9RHOB|nr:H-type lectin domain-containing protein [Paracoccus siganidrum]RJL10132.1 hypothetical protein D3P05_14295 [Paracoccus siganidrum]RMC28426.1 hypothetical protein C9E82_21355 [Paracoccus siganidrum]